MSDNLIYMFGKISKAVEILVTNNHDVKNRVWVAAPYLQMVQSGGLPDSCHEDIEWIHKMLVRYPHEPPYKSALDATYHRTRNSTAHKIAVRIWKLYHIMQTEVEKRLHEKNA